MGKCDRKIDEMCDKTQHLEQTAIALKKLTAGIIKKQKESSSTTLPVDIH